MKKRIMKVAAILFTTICLFSTIKVDVHAETIGSSRSIDMPTVKELDGEAAKYDYLVEGTDKYNDVFVKIGKEYGVDPVFIKVIMSVESCGKIEATNGKYYGPYQIGSSFGYDNDKLTSDVDYATECACEVFYIKGDDIVSKGYEPTVYNLAKWYNGSKSYAKIVSCIYEDLTNGSRDKLVLTYEL